MAGKRPIGRHCGAAAAWALRLLFALIAAEAASDAAVKNKPPAANMLLEYSTSAPEKTDMSTGSVPYCISCGRHAIVGGMTGGCCLACTRAMSKVIECQPAAACSASACCICWYLDMLLSD